jgi:ubiquitin carboxyl-terminal hydrolase 8
VKAASTDNLDDFEKAFPSISEFAKQYEDPPPGAFAFERDPDSTKEISGLPNVRPSRPQEARDIWRQAIHEEEPESDLPDVSGLPDLPSLPSVPISKPVLPKPPKKPDGLHGEALGPPSPDTDADIKRAASTPNVATLKGSPVDGDRTPLPPSRQPLGPRPLNSAVTSPPGSASPALNFPVPVPTAGPSKLPSAAPKAEKPKFPLTNSIDCDVLRTYILNPAVDVLLLDVRSEEETQRGYVGLEYEGRGKEIKNVWLDPHVVLRDG